MTATDFYGCPAIRALFEGELDGVQRIIASGSEEDIRLGIALGLRPGFELEGGDLKATFAPPLLSVTGFDPTVGKLSVRIVTNATIVDIPDKNVFRIEGAPTLSALMEEPGEVTVEDVETGSYQSDGGLMLKVQLLRVFERICG